MSDTENIIAQREGRYGRFEHNAKVTEDLFNVIAKAMGEAEFVKLEPYQREGLHMICHKLSRIACGDPDYDDNWVDIAGYAKRVAGYLQKAQADKPLEPYVVVKIAEPLETTTFGHLRTADKVLNQKLENPARLHPDYSPT